MTPKISLVRSAAQRQLVPETQSKRNNLREFTYYSKLLGCHVNAVKNAKKDHCKSIGNMFGYWMEDHKPELSKIERRDLIATVVALLTRNGDPDDEAPFATSLKPLLAEERRYFALSKENTSVLAGRRKKNKIQLDALAADMNQERFDPAD